MCNDYFIHVVVLPGDIQQVLADNCMDYIEWKYPDMHFGFHYNSNTATLRNLMECYDLTIFVCLYFH